MSRNIKSQSKKLEGKSNEIEISRTPITKSKLTEINDEDKINESNIDTGKLDADDFEFQNKL